LKGFYGMTEEIPIITGDPLRKEDGATFTCFVLPFRYQPRLLKVIDSHGGNSACYKPVEMRSHEWVSRKRYFTSETAKVLYEHARWFELSEDDWLAFDWCGNKSAKIFHFYDEQWQKFAVKFHPPRLMLFEWCDAKVKPVYAKAGDKENQDLFDTGFLVIKASFETHDKNPNYRDLLYFNEFFRYWRVPFKKHHGKMKKMLGNNFGWKPDAYYFQRWAKLLQIPFLTDKALCRLFPHEWENAAEAWWAGEVYDQASKSSLHTSAQMDNAGWICYADNRTFVWSCAVVKDGTNALERMNGPEIADDEIPTNLGGWIKFLNVDQPGKVDWINNATPFEKEWGKERYYDRWLHYDTLYGFNYHAGVMLTAPCDEPPIVRHFHDQYLDMTLLLLYLRITLFRFSRELTCLSAGMRKSRNGLFGYLYIKANNFVNWISNQIHRHFGFPKGFKPIVNWKKDFQKLRKEFAIFTNLYQFPLISNQQQAIEMYELIRKRMDVEELFKEVEKEIKSSHEYFQFEEESKLNRFMFWLTIIGIPIAIIGTGATILGIRGVTAYLCESSFFSNILKIICSC
jgi:hypothetical protein